MRVSVISTPTYHVAKGKELKRQVVKTPTTEEQGEINGVSFKGHKIGKISFGTVGAVIGTILGGPIVGVIAGAASGALGHVIDKEDERREDGDHSSDDFWEDYRNHYD